MKNSIKELRVSSELTQEDLAELLGVSRQTIISLEKGKYNPSLVLAFRLARVFERSIEDIFVFSEEADQL